MRERCYISFVRSAPGGVAATLFLLMAGCAPTAERVAEGAAPAGIEASLEALNEEETRRRFVDVLSESGEATATGAMRGIRSELEPASAGAGEDEWVNGVIEGATRQAMAVVREEMSRMTPELRNAASEAMAATLDEMLSPQRQEAAALMVDAVVRSAMLAMIETGSEGLQEELGPALEHMIREHISAGRRHTAEAEVRGKVETLAEPQVQALVSEAARNESHARAAGAHDALVEQEVLLSRGQSLLQEAQATVSMWLLLAMAGFAGLALLILGAAVVLGVLIIRGRRSAGNETVDHRAELLEDAVREAQQRPWGPELDEIVRERFRRAKKADKLHT